MDYDKLSPTYFAEQQQKISRLQSQISARDLASALSLGRVVPEEHDLALGTGRRLNMAVMFVDVVGFSAKTTLTLAEQHSMLNALNLFFTTLTRIATDYGGIVEKNTGDGLMIYFEDGGGDPSAPGVRRAVACSLTMQRICRDGLQPAWNALGVPHLPFRISIEYGELTIAKLGLPRGFNSYVAIGSAANFAAKMLAKGGPGDIVMGHRAMLQMPQDWQRDFFSKIEEPSGWVFGGTDIPYPVFKFTGVWRE